MDKYIYEGPIMKFDVCVKNVWKGETMAPTEAKARSNLTYQAKKLCGLVGKTRVSLPGKLYLVKEEATNGSNS